MNGVQQKPIFTTTYAPITESDHESIDGHEEAAARCGCFRRLSCFGWDESENYLLQERGGGGGSTWLVAELKKLKEPKSKNYVRNKLVRFCNSGMYNNCKQKKQIIQYSPESYALNFASDQQLQEDGAFLQSFSSRYASAALNHEQQRRTALY